MLRWLCAASIAAALTGFALLLVVSRYPEAGPVLFTLTPERGVHLGDLFILGAWAVSMLALAALVGRRNS